MSYFEDYDYPELSELDQLVDETTNKIKDMIILESKEKVDAILNKAKETQDRLNAAEKRVSRALQEIALLAQQNKKLKEELEQKRTSLNTLPFEIGQKVYYLEKWNMDEVVCPLCKGTGKVTTHSDQYGDVEIKCPNCKDNYYWNDTDKKIIRKASYDVLTISNTKVKGLTIRIELDEQRNIKQKVKVILNNHSCYDTYDVENIFTEAQLEQCKKECAERNKRYKEEAERKVGIIKTE